MGQAKRWLIEMQAEHQAAIDNLPETIDDFYKLFDRIDSTIELLTKHIKSLQDSIILMDSFKYKLKDFLWAGSIGAILGALITWLVN